MNADVADELDTGTPQRFGWHTFAPPPSTALALGVLSGAVVGAIIAYDVAVLVRLGRILRARFRRSSPNEL